MKSASELLTPEGSEHTSQNSDKHTASARSHYFLVALLLAVAYLLSTWVASAPNVFSTQVWSGFLLFWLGGGLITLFLLTLAAKR